jgi:hypothetical protein
MTAIWQWRGGDKQASKASAARQGVRDNTSSQTQQDSVSQPLSFASCDTAEGNSAMDLRWAKILAG